LIDDNSPQGITYVYMSLMTKPRLGLELYIRVLIHYYTLNTPLPLSLKCKAYAINSSCYLS
jgi:hypothetical protein